MKRILSFLLTILICISFCACGNHRAEDENLQHYGIEFANNVHPASDIAWAIAHVLEVEFARYDIDLRPSESKCEDASVSEFGEELEVAAICCSPHDPYESSTNGSGTLWIRVLWSPNTNELRNIYIEFNDDYLDFDSLVYSVFHNIEINGLSNVYDNLQKADTQNVGDYNLRIHENVVAIYFPGDCDWKICNIDFLPHTVFVKNEMLYFTTGKKVNIDQDWATDSYN